MSSAATTIEIAGSISLAGLGATVASLGYLHLQPTGLSPFRNAVSQYGISTYRGGYRAATISLGCAGAALAIGVATALRAPGTSVVVGLLAAFAVSRLFISWYPMDGPGAPPTVTGRRHGLLAIVTFGSAAASALRLGTVLDHSPLWHQLATVSTALGVAMLATLAGMFLTRFDKERGRLFGAVERLFYLEMIGWLAVFAVACAIAS